MEPLIIKLSNHSRPDASIACFVTDRQSSVELRRYLIKSTSKKWTRESEQVIDRRHEEKMYEVIGKLSVFNEMFRFSYNRTINTTKHNVKAEATRVTDPYLKPKTDLESCFTSYEHREGFLYSNNANSSQCAELLNNKRRREVL